MHAKTAPVIWGCFLLWNFCSSSSQTIYPGIKARVTQRALDYGELNAFQNKAVANRDGSVSKFHSSCCLMLLISYTEIAKMAGKNVA